MRMILSTETRESRCPARTGGSARSARRAAGATNRRCGPQPGRSSAPSIRTAAGWPRGPMEVSAGGDASGRRPWRPDVRRAIVLAARNIRKVANRQVPQTWQVATSAGVTIEQRVMPLDRVGCYVPGGRYPLPSSLLMTAVTARAAGVNDVVAVCPRPDPTVMLAALEAGVSRLFRLGGAHAIAALAYGTDYGSARRQDRRARQRLRRGREGAGGAGLCDRFSCRTQRNRHRVGLGTRGLDRRRPHRAGRTRSGCASDSADALPTARCRRGKGMRAAVTSRRSCSGGPEEARRDRRHTVHRRSHRDQRAHRSRARRLRRRQRGQRLTRAGTVFVGARSAQALGDYITGSNHVLPTGGAARARGGLSAADFVRVTSVQRVSARGLENSRAARLPCARAEGLVAHARSIEMRLEGLRAEAMGEVGAKEGTRP